jgi:hypothetical protein
MNAGKCRVCGCVSHDCSGCVERTGESCHWVEPDLCSACTGWSFILQERDRQVEVEGFDGTHDDDHDRGELRKAADCYAQAPAERANRWAVIPGGTRLPAQRVKVPKDWPWESEWWKPSKNRVRELVKAGALYLAEQDRQNRAGHRSAAGRMHAKARSCGRRIDQLGRTPVGLRWLKQLVKKQLEGVP